MKYFLFLLFVFTFVLFGNDCEKEKTISKEAGCKIENTESKDLITCLLDAKDDEEVKKCHKEEKSRNCKKIAEKFKSVKDLYSQCSLFFNSEKINCLLKADKFKSCQENTSFKKQNKK